MFQSFSISDTLCHSIYDLLLEWIYDWAFLCQHVSSGIALCIAVHSLCSLQEYHAVAEGFQSVRTHWRWWSAQNRGSLFSAHRSGEDNGGTSITPSIPFIGTRDWFLLSKVICSFLTVQIPICRVYLCWGPLHWVLLIVSSSNILRYLASNPWMACSAPAHTACGCWILSGPDSCWFIDSCTPLTGIDSFKHWKPWSALLVSLTKRFLILDRGQFLPWHCHEAMSFSFGPKIHRQLTPFIHALR